MAQKAETGIKPDPEGIDGDGSLKQASEVNAEQMATLLDGKTKYMQDIMAPGSIPKALGGDGGYTLTKMKQLEAQMNLKNQPPSKISESQEAVTDIVERYNQDIDDFERKLRI